MGRSVVRIRLTSHEYRRELENNPFHPKTAEVESWALMVQEIDTSPALREWL